MQRAPVKSVSRAGPRFLLPAMGCAHKPTAAGRRKVGVSPGRPSHCPHHSDGAGFYKPAPFLKVTLVTTASPAGQSRPLRRLPADRTYRSMAPTSPPFPGPAPADADYGIGQLLPTQDHAQQAAVSPRPIIATCLKCGVFAEHDCRPLPDVHQGCAGRLRCAIDCGRNLPQVSINSFEFRWRMTPPVTQGTFRG